jgi:chromosome segregation ATPase
MESTLKKLESRIEELIKAHATATERVAELEQQVKDLEGGGDLKARVDELETQRSELADRLETVLGAIDSALGD